MASDGRWQSENVKGIQIALSDATECPMRDKHTPRQIGIKRERAPATVMADERSALSKIPNCLFLDN